MVQAVLSPGGSGHDVAGIAVCLPSFACGQCEYEIIRRDHAWPGISFVEPFVFAHGPAQRLAAVIQRNLSSAAFFVCRNRADVAGGKKIVASFELAGNDLGSRQSVMQELPVTVK